MINYNLSDITKDLKRTKKAIVALGCSFVRGAEISNDIIETNDLTFLNVLCTEYLDGTYTPINFGQEAAGNFSAVSRLFLYDIPWDTLDEIIVIFLPTGMQRFDIIKDENSLGIGNEFKTLWPYHSIDTTTDWKNINTGYEKTCYSQKFEVLNFILTFQFLNSWASEHKAKLIIFPAFTEEYTKEYFLKTISTDISRDAGTHSKLKNGTMHNHYDYNFLINQIPWENFIKINNSSTFFDLCFRNDMHYNKNLSMFDVISNQLMCNNEWIMPGGHPSARGHRLLAEELFKILKN